MHKYTDKMSTTCTNTPTKAINQQNHLENSIKQHLKG